MLDVIQTCANNLGPAPRKFSEEQLEYLIIPRPEWARSNPAEKLNSFFDRQDQLLINGIVAWGHIIQANELLFKEGEQNHPAEIVYSVDHPLDADPQELFAIARRLYALKGTVPADPALQPIADYLADEFIRVFGLPVPNILSPSFKSSVSTVHIARKHLPTGKLNINLLPVLINPRPPHVAMVLPSVFWPENFTQWWSGGKESEARPEEPQVGTNAESILEMNQPFEEFLQQFENESAAMEYYRAYVERRYGRIGENGSASGYRIVWKRFHSRKHKGLLDRIIRHALPSSGWKDLTFTSEHRLRDETFRSIRRNLKLGRIGRIGCLLFGFISACAAGSMGWILVQEWADRAEYPALFNLLSGFLLLAAIVSGACLGAIPYFHRLSMPPALEMVSRGSFVVDSIRKLDD